MGFDHLEKFLQQKKEQNDKKAAIDWQEKKNEWLSSIQELYKTITVWLEPLREKKLLHFEFENINITEDHLGSYGTHKLNVLFPDQKVELTPIGRNIIGAAGRVDLSGRNGKIKILLVDEQSEGPKITVSIKLSKNDVDTSKPENKPPLKLVWKIATPPPNIKFIELNEDSFSDALFEVMGEYE